MRNLSSMAKVVFSNPQMLLVNPRITGFMCSYMNKFRVRKVGNMLILHSHLPPLNSRAYSRFVREHLIKKVSGPSHAQIAITNACPQDCAYCYNKNRTGEVMDVQTIIRVARDLKEMGVVWLGLTGGEPLLNKRIVEIVAAISDDCAVKLFTTGCGVTQSLASELKSAGLFSVSVSLDHWNPDVHNRNRGYANAFRDAINAIDVFKSCGDIDVGVSAVLPREMIRNGDTEKLLEFVADLGVHEAWLSEVKPSAEPFWNDESVISEEDRIRLVRLQDNYNSNGNLVVNYLGHFEGKECFGCNAGHKMVYIDAFGEVSPCVFTPMSFGNVRSEDLKSLFGEMRSRFSPASHCFINNYYRLLREYSGGKGILPKYKTLKMLQEVEFDECSEFFKLYYGGNSNGQSKKQKV